MKRSLLALSFLTVVCLNAQTYSISPAKTVTFSAPYNNVTINDIYMVNTGSSTLSITWELVSMNLPSGWDYSMCDLGTCHTGIPTGPHTMQTATVGSGNPFLGLNINPYSIAGTGTVICRVYRTGFASNADTVAWKISAQVVGIEELSADSQIKIYPSPATDKLNLNFNNSPIKVTITDAMGRIVLNPEVASGNNVLDLSGIQKGIYLVNILTSEKSFVKRIVKE